VRNRRQRTNGDDPVDKAILATELVTQAQKVLAQKRAEAHLNIDRLEPLNISIASTSTEETPRTVVFAFPSDMTEAELFEVVGLLGHSMRLELGNRALLRKQHEHSGVVIARAMPNQAPPGKPS
jgi:hypothetical protein